MLSFLGCFRVLGSSQHFTCDSVLFHGQSFCSILLPSCKINFISNSTNWSCNEPPRNNLLFYIFCHFYFWRVQKKIRWFLNLNVQDGYKTPQFFFCWFSFLWLWVIKSFGHFTSFLGHYYAFLAINLPYFERILISEKNL